MDRDKPQVNTRSVSLKTGGLRTSPLLSPHTTPYPVSSWGPGPHFFGNKSDDIDPVVARTRSVKWNDSEKKE